MIFIFIGLILILLGALCLVLNLLINKGKKNLLTKNKNDNYAIIIPARDESKVIGSTLNSIKIQNKDMSNTYVIIEDKNDPTYEIAKSYGANVYIRKKPIRQKKGYALDECLKDILKTKKYDLYFIFDADNVIEKDFIKKMLKYWHQGYELASAYRNILNSNNVISSCSGLLFCLQNTVLNKFRMLNKRSVILCGSGFYIDGKIIEKLNGFPFHSLTEDYELSLYLAENNIKTIYAEDCIYYDEQPTSLKTSIKQRVRWIRGILDANKNCVSIINKSLYEILVMASSISLISGIVLIILGISLSLFNTFISIVLFILIEIYLFLLLITIFLFIVNGKKISIYKVNRIKSILFNPIFLSTYVICFIKAIFTKEVKWDKIEHKGV